jgi:hypothetical protein
MAAAVNAVSVVVVVLSGVCAIASCAMNAEMTTQSRGDGTTHLKCRTSLPRCLEHAEDTCHGTRYTVLRAVDQHDYFGGGAAAEHEVRNSEAIIRCGDRAKALWGPEANPMETAEPPATPATVVPAPPAVPAPAPPPRICAPGGTQECIGAAACKGGQSCLSDGTGFSPCDCGATTAP